MARAVAGARASWPELPVEPEAFAAELLARVPHGQSPDKAIELLQGGDLWLARCALQGERRATGLLDGLLVQAVRRAVNGLPGGAAFGDEVRQLLRQKLLVGTAQGGPRLAAYNGTGPLAGFLQISARRVAINLGARSEPATASEDDLLLVSSPLPDPESEHLRATCRAEFEQALLAALQDLTPHQRLLLRQRFVDGLTGAAIARALGVAASTVTRSLQGALESLRLSARRRLAERLRLSESQIDSLSAAVVSRLEISLGGALVEE